MWFAAVKAAASTAASLTKISERSNKSVVGKKNVYLRREKVLMISQNGNCIYNSNIKLQADKAPRLKKLITILFYFSPCDTYGDDHVSITKIRANVPSDTFQRRGKNASSFDMTSATVQTSFNGGFIWGR